jgi:hypothetical protein
MQRNKLDLRIFGLVAITAASVIASFIAVWLTIAAMPSDATLVGAFIVIATFCFSAQRIFSLNAKKVSLISALMVLAWLVGSIFFIPAHAYATQRDKSGYDYHKYDFRAYVTAISVGLLGVLVLDYSDPKPKNQVNHQKKSTT